MNNETLIAIGKAFQAFGLTLEREVQACTDPTQPAQAAPVQPQPAQAAPVQPQPAQAAPVQPQPAQSQVGPSLAQVQERIGQLVRDMDDTQQEKLLTLIRSFGVDRVSALDPQHYSRFLAGAEGVANG